MNAGTSPEGLPELYTDGGPVALAARPWRLPAPFDRFRLGLRSRATWALGLGALVISVSVSAVTFLVARQSFVNERRDSVKRTAYANAEAAQSALSQRDQNVGDAIRQQRRGDAESLVVSPRGTFPRDRRSVLLAEVARTSLRPLVRSEKRAGYQIIDGANGSVLIVGVPLPVVNAEFYEVASLSEVERNLRRLGRTLAFAAGVSTLGAALLGRSISRRVVRPLRSVADAAAGIASGKLDTRLELSGDVDLDPLLRSFNDMAESLQRRIEREARFASDVSHELRTPLTALSTAAQLLHARRDELSERSQKTLDVLVNQTEHFRQLVLDLLEISRFDAGAAELHRVPVDLEALIRTVVTAHGDDPMIDATHLTHADVRVDKRRVERIVANLLQNASLYGGGATLIEIADETAESADDADGGDVLPVGATSDLGAPSPAARPLRVARIAVEDRGPGVPEAEHEAIFERFRRGQAHVRGTSALKGTGLGLALVAAHARLHGGRAWVEDLQGGGARFVVTLALGDDDDAKELR